MLLQFYCYTKNNCVIYRILHSKPFPIDFFEIWERFISQISFEIAFHVRPCICHLTIPKAEVGASFKHIPVKRGTS